MNVYLLILILSVVVASFAQILLKKSAAKTYRGISECLRDLWLWDDVSVHVHYRYGIQGA